MTQKVNDNSVIENPSSFLPKQEIFRKSIRFHLKNTKRTGIINLSIITGEG